jgi:hypothetical protein
MFQYFKTFSLALLLSVGVGSVGNTADTKSAAHHIQTKISSIIQSAKNECGNTFQVSKSGVKLIDLNSDGEIDLGVVDEAGYSCTELGSSMYCGSGGCSVHLITVNDYLSGAAQGWEIITTRYDEQVILMSLHGSSCSEPGNRVCYFTVSIADGDLIYQK